jgi:hypothetical protein
MSSMPKKFHDIGAIRGGAAHFNFIFIARRLIVFMIFTMALLIFSGASTRDSLILGLATIGQIIPGALLWVLISKKRDVNFSEILGMGLALGSLLSLLSSQLLRVTEFGNISWAIPLVVSVPILIWKMFINSEPLVSKRFSSNIGYELKSYIPTILFGIVQLSIWFRWHPLKWSGWWKYHSDVPYFESLSNSLAILGTTGSLMDPSLESRYHWFAYAWVGSLTNSLNIESFVVLTRLLPIVAITMAATVAYSWASSMSKRLWTPGIAALIVVIAPGLSVGAFVMLRSPSSAMTVGWSLGFSFLLFEIIKGVTRQKVAYFALGLLASGIVGGKASNSVIFGAALVAILVASFTQERNLRNRILTSGILSLVVIGMTFKLIIASTESRSLTIGLFLGFPGLLLTVLPTVLGIYGLSKYRQSNLDPLLCFTVSIFLVGALCSFFTHDVAGAQIYFLVSAATICIVPSLIGIEKLLYGGERVKILNLNDGDWKGARPVLISLVSIAGLLTFTIWIIVENSATNLGKVLRTLSPLLLYIVSALAIHKSFRKIIPKLKMDEKLSLFLVLVLSASLVSSSAGIINSIFNGPLYAKSQTVAGFGKSEKAKTGSISYNYVLAAEWVKKHIPSDAYIFTNRHCTQVNTPIEKCDGLWFYASALTSRQFLIEGNGFAVKTGKSALTRVENQMLSVRFSLAPNESDAKLLLAKNVRWGWIDRRVSQQTEWGEFAQEVYSNGDISIIKLLKIKD